MKNFFTIFQIVIALFKNNKNVEARTKNKKSKPVRILHLQGRQKPPTYNRIADNQKASRNRRQRADAKQRRTASKNGIRPQRFIDLRQGQWFFTTTDVTIIRSDHRGGRLLLMLL